MLRVLPGLILAGLILVIGLTLAGGFGSTTAGQVANVAARSGTYTRSSKATAAQKSPKRARTATAARTNSARSLIGASSEEIGKAALDFTLERFSARGPSQVLLVRPVTLEELPALGLDTTEPSCVGMQLALVILKGDYDVSNVPHVGEIPNATTRVAYLGYVWDLRVNSPMLIEPSVRGGRFRSALNDPSLPDDNPGYKPPTAQPGVTFIPAPTMPKASNLPPCDYGPNVSKTQPPAALP